MVKKASGVRRLATGDWLKSYIPLPDLIKC
jgi:hypothetical protein